MLDDLRKIKSSFKHNEDHWKLKHDAQTIQIVQLEILHFPDQSMIYWNLNLIGHLKNSKEAAGLMEAQSRWRSDYLNVFRG